MDLKFSNLKRFPVNVSAKWQTIWYWMDILATKTFNKRKHQLKRKMIDTYISFRHIRTEPSMFVQEVILFIWLVCLFSCLLAACYLDGIFSFTCKCACQRAVNISSTRETEKKSNEIFVFVLNLKMVWVDLVTYTLSKSIFGCLENRRGFISILVSPLLWLFVAFTSLCFSF